MAKYYFHVRSGATVNPDEEGSELPNAAAAKEEALKTVRELLAEAIRFGRQHVPDCIIIADAHGREIMTVPFKEVLPEEICG